MTVADERDPVVARALATLPVPDHGEDFWARLDTAVRAEAAPAGAAPAGGVGGTRSPGAPLTVVELAPHRRPGTARPGRRWVAAAAVLVLVAAAAGARLLGEDDATDQPAVTLDATTALPATTAGTTAPVAPAAPVAPEVVVADFLDRLGAGDAAGARALVGPLSVDYLAAAADGIDATLLEVAGPTGFYGAWATSTDRRVTTVPLGHGDAVVVVQGTHLREGASSTRPEAVPVVRGADGVWRVELWAFDASSDNAIAFVAPDVSADGVAVLHQGDAVRVGLRGPGTAWLAATGMSPEAIVVHERNQTAHWTTPVGAPAPGGYLLAASRSDAGFVAVVVSTTPG